jgi:hypothetical protein
MTAETIDNYYKILGLQKNAPLDEIKKAYREKAKILHPDKNKRPDAHEKFILLNEAYEYLHNLKTGKIFSQSKQSNTAQPKSRRSYSDWNTAEREKARTRAQQYAKMQYGEFIKTDYYKSIVSLNTIASHIGFFIAITVVVIFPIVTTILYGFSGLGAGLLVNFVVLPMTVNAIRDSPPLNFGEFSDSVLHIIKTNGFLITSLTIVNILVILKFGLQTLISPWAIITFHCSAIILVYLILHLKKVKTKIYYYSFCIAPLVINSTILINFLFSFNPLKETYFFRNDTEITEDGKQKSSLLLLENNVYEEYPGIRAFIDYEKIKYKSHITYTFKNGILGLRVMTDYEFKP